ncbi:MAG TPA: hypothetical protein VNT26_06650 [Candidatus Sulfotelmatobacter sp.]|nr:hypothetical protein [Candidatus Sulfotelmatobacter sp.]
MQHPELEGKWVLLYVVQQVRNWQLGVPSNFSQIREASFGLDLTGLGGQPAALVIVEAGFLAQLFFEDPDLLLEVFNDVLLVAVEPSQTAKPTSRNTKGFTTPF